MSESLEQLEEPQKIISIPMVAWIPLPSAAILAVAFLINSLIGIGIAILIHFVFIMPKLRAYRRLPAPMPVSQMGYHRTFGEHTSLLVKGIPDSFFEILHANRHYLDRVVVTYPRKGELLRRSLIRYSEKLNYTPEFVAGDSLSITVQPAPMFYREQQINQAQSYIEPTEIHCDNDKPDSATKRKIILD